MTSTDTAVRKPRKPRAAPVEAAPPLAPTLPADLEAMDRQIASDDEAAAMALLRGRKARREMVDEIAMLRRQVEALTNMNGDLVAGLKTFEDGYNTGEPKFRVLFALTPGATDQAKALKAERETFYAARMAKDEAALKAAHPLQAYHPTEPQMTPAERNIAADLENALANEPVPGFLLGTATHPLEKPQPETISDTAKKIAAVAVLCIGLAAFRLFA